MTQAFRQERGKPHLVDPYLPDPKQDLVFVPWGWTVYTLCGFVLRRSRPVADSADLCRRCSQRATQRLPQAT